MTHRTLAWVVVAASSSASALADPPPPCNVRAIVKDPDPRGLNVRAAPKNGKVLGTLPSGTEVTLLEAREGWVRVGSAWHAAHEERSDWPSGWVHGRLLSTELKTPAEYGPTTIPRLRTEPADTSPSTPIDWQAAPRIEIIGCSGAFLEVSIRTGDQKQRGFLGRDSHCASTVTTCP
jgi:hypothetical protein